MDAQVRAEVRLLAEGLWALRALVRLVSEMATYVCLKTCQTRQVLAQCILLGLRSTHSEVDTLGKAGPANRADLRHSQHGRTDRTTHDLF